MFDKDDTLITGPTNMTQANENTTTGEKTYELGFTALSLSFSLGEGRDGGTVSYTLQVSNTGTGCATMMRVE